MHGSTADRRLDVGFVDDLKGPPYHWKQILVPGELKSNPSADTASKAWIDLGRYAREVLAAQDTRRFVMGFTLCGSLMRVLCRWSLDFWMDEEDLGFELTVMVSDKDRFIKIPRNGSTDQIAIDGVILRARCVAGRAVTCWKAHPKGHPETPLVIKDSWQYPERDEEGDLLREVTDKGIIPPNKMVKDDPRKGRPGSSKKRPSSLLDSALPSSKRSCSMSPTKVPSTAQSGSSAHHSPGLWRALDQHCLLHWWNYESDETLAELQMGVVADEQYFQQKITESFTAQYQPLVPWDTKL
ncbi:hypothetical protein CTAM01_17061 [Colletotrichum tamarilloi]|uniref:Fungal-type protein kinase domain-containing protein n=1 Tax=Colletotrichum tamarilloi TaxID=1209934 RepID=A0ABQ9QGR4_9PEZI|nr:uncharacterized protein CTAM01_17061 [Colletotrichum tamarilloi]KAK1465245.1 hypothetical protein CTAM01_17061 [Colletotrichum tamarilloi]